VQFYNAQLRYNKIRDLTAAFIWGLLVGGLLLLLPKEGLPASADRQPMHAIFDGLLSKYNRQGRVDYGGFKREEANLDAYLDLLAEIEPGTLGRDQRIAFYINAYNAWTIKLVLSGYPGVESIKDFGSLFKSPWKKRFVRIGSQVLSLDHIENDILRPQFKDPRIHFAINCASKSCPQLYHEAFAGSRLDAQLDDATRRFINDKRFNRLEEKTLYVSRIFKWYRDDFDGDIIGFFERYAAPPLKAAIVGRKKELKIEYLDYDWSLNGE
jgi:hypothetical protein